MRKIFLINAVHLCEMRHICDKHIYFDSPLERGSSFFKDGGEVRDAEFSHGCDRGGGREKLAGRGQGDSKEEVSFGEVVGITELGEKIRTGRSNRLCY